MNDYGKWVKKRLIDMDKNQTWLIEQIQAVTGLYCDGGYLSKIFNGKRAAPKIVGTIDELLKED